MKINGSDRLKQLGSAIFAEVDEWKHELRSRGMKIIDLSIGSPDLPPSKTVLDALETAVKNPANYRYPTSEGTLQFRETVAEWYRYRFNVGLDPHKEVLTLMGSQDGLAHLAMAIANPGDVALVPNPGYPIYSASLVLAGVYPVTFSLKEKNHYLPNLDEFDVDVVKKAKFMLLNYPSNPLSAVADRDFFEHIVQFARQHELLIVHDLAYSEMAFDGFSPCSILEVEGAKDICVEFNSLSKSFNMAGCRIGYMVGHKDVISALKALKSNIDYGVFTAIQEAGIVALKEDMLIHDNDTVAHIYERRRDVVIQGLKKVGWDIPAPKATMFIWAKIPSGWTSRQISREILFATGVATIPGDAFGSEGEGYVRIALVQEEHILEEAVEKIGAFLKGVSHATKFE